MVMLVCGLLWVIICALGDWCTVSRIRNLLIGKMICDWLFFLKKCFCFPTEVVMIVVQEGKYPIVRFVGKGED